MVAIAAFFSSLSSKSKYYCHFYEYLQAVCLRIKNNKGLVTISTHTAHERTNHFTEPVHTSRTWRIRSEHSRQKGVWSLPRSIALPWDADDAIHYAKVSESDEEYYDVNFTMNARPRKFIRLTPVYMNELFRDYADQDSFEFTADGPFVIRSTVSRQARSGRDMDATLMSATVRDRRKTVHFKDSHRHAGKIRALEAPYQNVCFIAEAFLFAFPAQMRQYGILIRFNKRVFILYRRDQAGLRG